MMSSVVSLTEKLIIVCALLAGIPLTHLDQVILGFRRFVWLGVSAIGLINVVFLDPTSDMAGRADATSMALLSVALVPHFVQLVKDQTWLGIGVLPPFFMVTFQSTQTRVDPAAAEYWKLRAFLHLFAFTLPYLNHLPSPPSSEIDETAEEGGGEAEMTDGKKPNDEPTKPPATKKASTRTKTNKKKR